MYTGWTRTAGESYITDEVLVSQKGLTTFEAVLKKHDHMPWARYSPNGYECSSKGDKRFSALFARLEDGRTIEEAYQLDVKGYRHVVSHWTQAKGQPPLNGKTRLELLVDYIDLWDKWAMENPELITELEEASRDKVLTDMFATSEVNQAHALSRIIDCIRSNRKLPFEF